MTIPRGFEMMAQSIIKMLGLDPRLMMEAVEAIRRSLHNGAADLAAIRRDQRRIMTHLGLSEEHDNGQLEFERHDGREAGTGEGPGNAGAGN